MSGLLLSPSLTVYDTAVYAEAAYEAANLKIKPLVQPQKIHLIAVPAMSFIFNEFLNWSGTSDGGWSQVCSCEHLVSKIFNISRWDPALRWSKWSLNSYYFFFLPDASSLS